MHPEKNTKPFLQWIGGKRKIASQLKEYIPKNVKNYYEPFLGGGALFFNVSHLFKKCFLSDINLDLVTSYNAIKNNPREVCKQVMELNKKHTTKNYYKLCQDNYTNNPLGITARFIYATHC
jgi:DNA adenine methylase